MFDTNDAQQTSTNNTEKNELGFLYITLSKTLFSHTHTQHTTFVLSVSPKTPVLFLSTTSDLSLSLSLSLNGLCYRNFDFHGLLQGQLGIDISIFIFVICFSFTIQLVNRCFQIYDFFLIVWYLFYNHTVVLLGDSDLRFISSIFLFNWRKARNVWYWSWMLKWVMYLWLFQFVLLDRFLQYWCL